MPNPLSDYQRKRFQLEQSLSQALYTVDEAAKEIGIAPSIVRALIRKGELDSVRPTDRTTRISKQAIIEYLQPSPFKDFF